MDTAKLFKNGRSQAVRLPQQYRFPGDQVFIRRFGKAIVLLPEKNSWDVLIESTKEFSDDFLAGRNQGTSDKREAL
ncbi:AbrB/MazE/SpoVT family DNA-binding domain-containing protein [Horticoccus luteus]|uniref:AbrB/MazE/SpoVT family DNA-binding domain-containing protein n=1 Tax=Horticoccus luteus TaxID=2862869 RepID=A0A8F9TUC8_9BACT|nr:type II toxin-antitoxin system VapB family antitoxin [Horticoccus luteus]QYM79215.1 AbrB/MazE/SpoVT family DNA-binding domain-containing protein [Horticoccus luteus]